MSIKKLFLLVPAVLILVALTYTPDAHASSIFQCYPVSVFKCSGNVTSISTTNGTINVSNGTQSTTPGSLANYGSVSGFPNATSGSLKSFLEENLTASLQATQPANSILPYGLFNFYVTGLPLGGTTNVTITFTKDIPSGAQWWKVINGTWIDASQNATISGNKLTLSLTDGGSLDEDGVTNGQIVDPGALLFFNASPPTGGSGSPLPNLMKPSFGDVIDDHYACGLKINGICHDITTFMVQIPKNIIPVNGKGTIELKIKPVFGSYNFQSATIYADFTDPKNPMPDNSDLAVQWDKNNGFTIIDKNNVLSNYTAIEQHDMIYQYITFKFVASKSVSDTNLILQALDEYGRVNKIFVEGAMQFGSDPPVQKWVQPSWLLIFNNKSDLANALTADNWNWPTLPTRASYPNQIFNANEGSIKYFYDRPGGIIVGEVFDSQGNLLWQSPFIHLTKNPSLSSQDERYSGIHLNPMNIQAIENAKAQQAELVQRTLQEEGIKPCVYSGTCSN